MDERRLVGLTKPHSPYRAVALFVITKTNLILIGEGGWVGEQKLGVNIKTKKIAKFGDFFVLNLNTIAFAYPPLQ